MNVEKKISLINKYKRQGDISSVCRAVGYSETTYYTAMNRADDRYTDAELLTIDAMYKKMRERINLRRRVGVVSKETSSC